MSRAASAAGAVLHALLQRDAGDGDFAAWLDKVNLVQVRFLCNNMIFEVFFYFVKAWTYFKINY